MDELYMRMALEQAKIARDMGEVPVGACIVCDGRVIALSHNTRETERNAIRHAEITAIEEACRVKNGWRLSDCTLYVTLEPCLMCTGALAGARIGRVVYGAKDSVGGACGSIINTARYPSGLKCPVEGGVLEKECAEIISFFFAKKRAEREGK